MVKRPNSSRKRPVLAIMLVLLQKWPMAFWGSIWAMVALLGYIAINGLLSPTMVKERVPDSSNSIVFVQNSESKLTEEQSKPLWVFGAIVLGCALGSLLLMRQFNPTAPRKPQKRLQNRSTSHYPFLKPNTRSGQTHSAASVTSQKRSKALLSGSSSQPLPARPTKQAAKTSNSSKNGEPTPEPLVTVVPAEETHPLDWGGNGLADMMDIRKRRSYFM